MLLQKHFKLVPNQDNNLEELINELALSKKNIKEIREYGTKLKKYNDSTYKGYNNNIEDNETYNNLNINKDNIIYDNDNNLIYKEDNITYKKNIINNNYQLRTRNGSISNVLLNKKRRKEKIKEQTNISKKEDNDYNLENYNDKNINKNEYSKSPIHKDTSEYNLFCSSNVLNLSNFKDNALFQRIYKSIEEEKMKSKYEKIKNKKEEWKKKKLKNEHIRNERIINEKIKNEKIIYERLHNKNSNKISNKIIQVEELLKDEKKKKNEILKAKRKCSYNKTFRSFSPDVNTSEYSDNISFNKNNNNNYMKHNFINYNEDGKRKIYIYYNDMNKKENKKIKNVDNNIKPLYHIWNKKNYTIECDDIKKKKKKKCNKKGKGVQYNSVMKKKDQTENFKKQIKNNNNNINENLVKSYNNKRKHKKKCKRMNDICNVKSNDENIIDYKKMFTTFKNLKHIKKKNILREEKADICDNIISKYNNSSKEYLNITTSNESVKSLKSNSSYIFKYKHNYIPNSLLINNQINNIKENKKKKKSMNPSLKQNILCKSNDINLYVHKYQYLVLKKRKRKFMHLKSIIQQKGDRHKCIHMFKKWIHQNNVRLSNSIINDHFDNNIKDDISNKFPSKLNKNETNWIIDNDIYMNSTECSDKREDTILTSHIISSNDNNGYIPVEEILIEHANTNREEDKHIDIINNKEENISSNPIIKGKIHSSHLNNMDTNMLNKDISINILNSVENIEDINNMNKSFNLSCLKMNNENNNNSNEDNTNMLLCKNIDIEEQNNTQKDNSKSESDISYTLYSQKDEKKDGTHSNNYTSNCLNSYTDLENMNIPCSNNDKIFKDVLSFYNMYKDKVKFLLLEECNYLKSLRNMMEEGSKNISENINNNIPKNEYYSNNIFEKNQNLFDELLKTLKSNKMSENSRHNNLFDMNRNSENEKNMKNNIIESNKNDVINFYKDPINFLLICNQTEKRIKDIERILNINYNDSNSSKVNIINDEYNMRKTNNIFEKKEMNCNKNENEKKQYEENNFICNNNDDFINIINPSQYNKNKIEETNFRNKNPFLSVFNFNSLILENTIRDLQKENNDYVKKKKKTKKYIKARKNKYFKSSHLYTMHIQNNVDYLYKRKRKSSIYYIINLKSVDTMCQNIDIRYIVLNNIRRKNFKYSFPIIKRNYYIKRYFNYNPKINPKGKKYIFLFKYNKLFYKISDNKKKDIDLIGMKYKYTPESIMIPKSDKDNFLNSKVSNNKLKYVHTSINHSKDLPNKEEKNMVYFPSIDNIKKEENIDITYENTKNVFLYSQEVDKNIHIHVHNNNDIHLNNNCEYMKSNILEKNHFDLLTSNILNNNLKYQEENDNNPLSKNKLNHSYNSIKSLDIKNDIKLEENNNVTKIKEMKINYNKTCNVHVQKNDMSKQNEDNKINIEKKNMLSNNKEYITNSIKYELSNNYYNNKINNENDSYNKINNIHSLNIDNTCDDYSSLHLQKDKKNNRIRLNGNKKKKEYFFNLYESNYNPFHSRDKITSMNKLNNSYDNIVNTLCSSVGGGENFHLSNNKNYMFNKNKSNSIIRTSEHINSFGQRNKDKSKIINDKNSNENFNENDMIHSLNVQEKASQYDHTNILENKNFDNINKLRNKRNIAYKKKDDLFFNNDTNKNIITSMSERDYLNVAFEEAKKEDNSINNKKLQNNNFNSNSIQKCVMKNMNEDNLFLYNNNNNKISSDLNIDSKFLYTNNIIQNEYNLDNYNFIKKEGKYNYSNVKPIMNTLINNNINNKSKVFIKEEDILGKNKKENFKLCESNKNSSYFTNENMNSNKLLNVEPNKDYNIKALSYNINRNINGNKLNESQRYDSSFIINNEESNFIDNKNIHQNENWECNYKDALKTNFGNTLKNNNEYMSNYYINSILSHSFNIYENKSIYEDDCLQNSLSSSIMDMDKLDEVIQKIRTFKTMNERNNNYISCLYCDKYLFKLDNYHEDFFFVCSNKEEIRKEKYTCSICKHKLRVLNKYKNDNVQKYIHIKSNDTIQENSTNRIIKNMDNNINVKRDTMNDIYMEDDYIKHYNGHDNNYINYSNNNNYNDDYRKYEENHSDYTINEDKINQSNMFYLNKDFQDGFSYNVDKKRNLYSRKKKFCDFKGLNNFDTKNLYSEFCNVPKESNISSSYTSYKSNITNEKNELRNSKNGNNNYANDIYNICNNKSNNDMNRTFNNIHKNYKSYSDDEINKMYNKNDDMIKIDKRFSLDMRLLKLRRKNHENNIIQKGLLHNNNNKKKNNKKNNNKKNSLYHNNSSSLIIDGMTNVNRTNMNTYEKEKSIYNINIKQINENKNIPYESNFLNRTIENTPKCYNYMNYYISEDKSNNNNNNNNNFEYQIEKNYMLNEDKYKGIDNEQVTNFNLENIHLKEKKNIKEMRTSNNENYPLINQKHNLFKSLLINGDKNMLNISNDENNCFKKYYSTYIN
ncbi:conserved Plasmodium protein, unknown function [Plasmodium sp. DRC-Itaito]|nr:conserved Plasmodium protein, unknown function [Plasmodium sp. DRC-Itaito]